jgi:hypothetical protein
MSGGAPESTKFIRLITAVTLSAAAAWSAVTLFNLGAPRRNETARPTPRNFGLVLQNPAESASSEAFDVAHEKPSDATVVTDLPPITSPGGTKVHWDGIDGLRIERAEGDALVPGQTPVGMRAVRTPGAHRLGIAFTGLQPGHAYRATVWAKPGSLSRIVVECRDGGSIHSGIALFDLAPPAVATTSGNLNGLAARVGSDKWVKASIDLVSADGIIVIYVGLVLPDGSTKFIGLSNMHLEFGGVEIEAAR